uniref:Uncharacterized protein n=1 Tax=Anguilla anguilla TaxID=7936 RepID=A0A0E9T8X7_ANGAN
MSEFQPIIAFIVALFQTLKVLYSDKWEVTSPHPPLMCSTHLGDF